MSCMVIGDRRLMRLGIARLRHSSNMQKKGTKASHMDQE